MSRLLWMADALRGQDLEVHEVKDWKTRGRPGTFEPRGVVFHHTASGASLGDAPSLRTCVRGRPGINGPLCNVLVGRDGTVHLVAAGKANHAGLGGPFRNIPRDSANAYLAGVEVENNGTGEPWSADLLHTCDVVFATLLLGLRRSPAWLIGHKEWAPRRKIDPASLDMEVRRRRVAKQMAAQSGGSGGRPGGRPAPANGSPRTHLVAAGDTLYSIARQNRMSVEELAKANHLDAGRFIHPGQQLVVGR